jgi:hypothetical protein
VDSAKLNIQNIVSGRKILNTILNTYKNEGIKGFFSGVGVASVLYFSNILFIEA